VATFTVHSSVGSSVADEAMVLSRSAIDGVSLGRRNSQKRTFPCATAAGPPARNAACKLLACV